ncbi:PLP-dependent aminotransferase family protein [Bariatricus massiliensis]|uniref:PLP-dependent aminotransferase family protein n=1 Tax=Bariatricus massiliensis TaxID=1745713 RepID=A0ABS8DJ97_9FIRM|nr:PLP-dependent aminotransferase family protein [Bariatricus massiliensis]MCB7305363.1 PLP-dependent aminotransferase family protein [Bariatricus massiliensis]MCB7375917.1 PLP-dependent aminotransferase family protein [Bariatricus massiliensis]MCB7388506.1 PLP-dependent aminotransferase family protein [Bariatricus massiliensis]MCB7412679.1 PLP-dependent aminotransferase family protein [Bariatricus massiliensis]MCQ5252097.1 PLP-dependent aminotransferase family protein [Bariatricus massiliensi
MQTELENEKMHRYLRVYNYYKELILDEKLPAGTKLPSIRKGAVQFQMSRTTLESAYLLLAAEGYIISRPQSGYYVTDIAGKRKAGQEVPVFRKVKQDIRYDFASSGVDKESFRFELWRRYMKSALRQDERLLSYGEPQGEYEFREVLCSYLREKRNVICTPRQVVIGAGVQSLLHVLCPLVKERRKAAFYNPDFFQGKAVFEDFGFEIEEDYRKPGVGIYYVTPSQMTKWGEVMQVPDRLELIRYADEKGILLIEDDYNNEFRYFQKPTPSLQGLAGGGQVVYLGTFSKLLLPSIRMSFMVLTPELLAEYEKRKNFYNQTASKAEQIALTQFIRDGHLDSQIRKSRKTYMTKAKALEDAIYRTFGKAAKVLQGEAGFTILVTLKTELHAAELAARLRCRQMAVTPIGETQERGENRAVIMLSCANVGVEDYGRAMEILWEEVQQGRDAGRSVNGR